jgi:hypothetical protein
VLLGQHEQGRFFQVLREAVFDGEIEVDMIFEQRLIRTDKALGDRVVARPVDASVDVP